MASKLTVMTLGQLIDKAHEVRERKRAITSKLDKVDAEYKEIEAAIFTALAAQDVTASKGTMASASISTSTKANPIDWEAFYKWLKRTGNFHLMQRRISDAAYVEMLGIKGAVPGLEPVYVNRLNVHSL